MSASFLAFSLVLASVIAMGIVRYFRGRVRSTALIALALWMLYAGALGYSGILANPARRPPGIAFLLAPFVLWLMALTRLGVGRVIGESVPLQVLVGMQGFRFVVELYLDQLWSAGMLPRMMTFHGTNFDIVVGVSAPILALLIVRQKVSRKAVRAWNFVGLLVLANVVARGILTAPGPLQFLHADFPNRAIGTFPFTYIAGLMVPLAATLHVASILAVRNEARSAVPIGERVASTPSSAATHDRGGKVVLP